MLLNDKMTFTAKAFPLPRLACYRESINYQSRCINYIKCIYDVYILITYYIIYDIISIIRYYSIL